MKASTKAEIPNLLHLKNTCENYVSDPMCECVYV